VVIWFFIKRDVEQFNGREVGTATFIRRCVITVSLRVARSRPRHLNRSAFRGCPENRSLTLLKFRACSFPQT